MSKDDLDHDDFRDSWSSDHLPDLQELNFYEASVVVTNNVISLIDIYDNIDAFNDRILFVLAPNEDGLSERAFPDGPDLFVPLFLGCVRFLGRGYRGGVVDA